MTGHSIRLGVAAGLGLLLAGCAPSETSEAAPPPAALVDESVLAVPGDPELARGQAVYRADCATCHDRGKKGAPKFGDPQAWAPRLAQGQATLVRHATEGFFGPAGDEMPARGGNDDLTDADVAAAVRYLTHPLR